MNQRVMAVVCIVLVLVVVFGATAGCRAENPEHWSFPVVSWMSQHTAGPNGGAVIVAMFFGLFIDLVMFPVTGIRDLIYILSEPPGPSSRSLAAPPE